MNPAAPPVIARPGAREGQVWVWWAGTDTAVTHRDLVAGLMNEAERDRYGAMRRLEARDRFAVGCALMRVASARHLGVAPAAVRIERDCPDCGGPHGKPRIAGSGTPEISLTHAGAYVVCAVAWGGRVGVDVEDGARLVDCDLLAGKILGPEEAEVYGRLPERERPAALVTYWTRKEAVLKATGDGLRVPMRALTVSGPADRPRLLDWAGGDRVGGDRVGRGRAVRPEPMEEVAMWTLRGPEGMELGRTTGALAVLGASPSRVVEIDAGPAMAAFGAEGVR
ncbi:4'-phosphopantetheinyl transferase family protein [Sphaerimonospora sp. CA-214678]|uniref:4'-phosphopantetheinyl transferase family protein n=1 Tax=Sphaerimonospora sp. CA-214678 TaxID=3240029 RepID=UPI003D8DA279